LSTVSIIIPAFNAAAYIAETIQSCLAQTYKDIEIIVVDDGSTDNTKEVVQRFPVTYIYQSNRGPNAARNNGWRHSNADYLQFLDADDILLPTKIERCIHAFSPDVDVVYTDHEYRSADLKEALPTSRAITPEGNILRLLLASTRSLFPPHAPLIRRSTADRTRKFNEQLQYAEDWYFWIELAAQGAVFRYLDEILVWYRATPGSRSQDPVKMAQGRLASAEALSQLPLPKGFDLGQLLAERQHVLGIRFWAAGDRIKARQHLRQAVKLSPRSGRRRLVRCALIVMSYCFRLQTAEMLLNKAVGFGKTR
jgi:hypothetical protein